MAKLERFNGNVKGFASESIGLERTVFGSTSQSDDINENLNTAFKRGWGIVGANDLPTKQDFNGSMFTHGSLLAYLYQSGVPAWNDEQEFYEDNITNRNGILYRSLQDDNVGNDPETSPLWWGSVVDVAMPQNLTQVQGLIMSNNSGDADHDIDFTAGSCLSDDFSTLMIVSSALTKRFDATFTAGNNGGGLDTGSLSASGTVHIYVIANPTTGDVDILGSASLTPTMPSGYTKKRRIMGFRLDSSANFRAFYNRGNYIGYKTPSIDVNTTTMTSASRTARSMAVPTGIPVFIRFRCVFNNGSGNETVIFTDSDEADVAPNISGGSLVDLFDNSTTVLADNHEMWTNTSGQIYDRSNVSSVDYYRLATRGYTYPRDL